MSGRIRGCECLSWLLLLSWFSVGAPGRAGRNWLSHRLCGSGTVMTGRQCRGLCRCAPAWSTTIAMRGSGHWTWRRDRRSGVLSGEQFDPCRRSAGQEPLCARTDRAENDLAGDRQRVGPGAESSPQSPTRPACCAQMPKRVYVLDNSGQLVGLPSGLRRCSWSRQNHSDRDARAADGTDAR